MSANIWLSCVIRYLLVSLRIKYVMWFYHIVANVRLAHSSSDRCFGSVVLKYEIWNEWFERTRESVLVCENILFKKRGVLIDMTSQKLSLIFHRNAVKKWSFLLEISAVSFNITTWKYVCTKNVLNMNVLVKKGGWMMTNPLSLWEKLLQFCFKSITLQIQT